MDYWPKTPEERLAAFRQIVADKSYAKIDGTAIDLTTANIVCQAHDALNPDNQAKFRALPTVKMALVALKLAR
jgi:hypothetical protein